jgi:hypothetical protein
MLRYIWSLNHRISCVAYSLERVEEAGVHATEVIEKIRKVGAGSYDPILILIYYYEAFFDQIYKALENIAKINLFLYDSKRNPPHDFQKQRNHIIAGKLSFSKSYDRVMKKDMDWYGEVLRIRENTNHYAIGTGVYRRDDEGKPILQYLNYEISRRKANCGDAAGKIESNILHSARDLHARFQSSINAIASAWLDEVDPSKKGVLPFLYPDRLEMRNVSLEEYRAGQLGELVTAGERKRKTEI